MYYTLSHSMASFRKAKHGCYDNNYRLRRGCSAFLRARLRRDTEMSSQTDRTPLLNIGSKQTVSKGARGRSDVRGDFQTRLDMRYGRPSSDELFKRDVQSTEIVHGRKFQHIQWARHYLLDFFMVCLLVWVVHDQCSEAGRGGRGECTARRKLYESGRPTSPSV